MVKTSWDNWPKLKFLKTACFGYSFNKIYSLRVAMLNFPKVETMSLATEKTLNLSFLNLRISRDSNTIKLGENS